MKIEMGIGWMPDEKIPGNLRSANDRDYVAEIERLRLRVKELEINSPAQAALDKIERLQAELAATRERAICYRTEYPYCDADLDMHAEAMVAAERERCARLELKIRRLLDENGPLIAVCREFIERWPTEEGIDNTIQRARAILLDHDLRSPPAEKVAAAIRKGEQA